MKRNLIRTTIVAVAFAGGIAGGYLYRGRALASPPDGTSTAIPPSPDAVPPSPDAAPASPGAQAANAPMPTASLPGFSAIVQRYGPAVVNVSVTGTTKASLSGTPFGQVDPNDPFFQFFRHFGIPQQQGPQITRGLGSGFIVRSDGLILTNAHVVDGASKVVVKLTDKREFPAKVVGIDKTTDVAVLKIDAKGLPIVKPGDPRRVRVGDWVLAIGSPFGFENSATAGIVSARGRTLPDAGYVPFLQTDVAVNPGNSGGPLFDAAGEVVGINSQIYSQSGGYMGLSFAIPIDVATHVEDQILAHGKVVRGRLGVTIQDVNQDLANSFGLPRPEGALVSSVQKDSAAAKAGLKPGDVILSMDQKPITASSELPPRVADLAPGTRVRLEVWRDHQKRDVEVKVGEAKDEMVSSIGEHGKAQGKLGIQVRPLAPQERKQAGVDGGLLVEGVQGPAARAGIEPGDVLLALNGTPVKDVDQLRGLLSKAGKHVALLVERGDARIFVPVDLG